MLSRWAATILWAILVTLLALGLQVAQWLGAV
jgi:hypothetical protein